MVILKSGDDWGLSATSWGFRLPERWQVLLGRRKWPDQVKSLLHVLHTQLQTGHKRRKLGILCCASFDVLCHTVGSIFVWRLLRSSTLSLCGDESVQLPLQGRTLCLGLVHKRCQVSHLLLQARLLFCLCSPLQRPHTDLHAQGLGCLASK